MAYQVSFVSGPLRGQRRELQRRRMDLGSDLGCHIWLDDASLAPRHAELDLQGGGVQVRSLVADRLVRVNGIEVQEALLAPGDELQIGASRIRFGRAPGQWRRIVPIVAIGGATITGLIVGGRMLLKRALTRGEPIPAVVRTPAARKPPEVVTPGLHEMERIDAGMNSTNPPAPSPSSPPPPAAQPPPTAAPAIPVPEVPEIPPTPELPRPPTPAPDIPAVELPSPKPAPPAPAPIPDAPTAAEQQAARERAARETAAAALLAEAQAELNRGDAAAADRTLARLQTEQPDYLPGLAARARRLESLNQLGNAEKLWIRVLQHSTSGPLYDEAATALARIAAKQIPDSPAPVVPEIPIQPPEPPPEAPVLPVPPKPKPPVTPTPAPAKPPVTPIKMPKPVTPAPVTPAAPRPATQPAAETPKPPAPAQPQPPPAPVAVLPAPAPATASGYRPPFAVLPESPGPTNAAAARPDTPRATAARPKPAVTPRPAPDADPGIRIVSIEPQRFPATADVADMRTLRITLVPAGSTETLRPEQIRLEVQFYDLLERTGVASPSRAAQSIRSDDAGETWESGQARTYTAVYSMPRSLYDREELRGNAPRYYGYRVRVFYNNRLQDQQAKPLTLPLRSGSTYPAVPR